MLWTLPGKLPRSGLHFTPTGLSCHLCLLCVMLLACFSLSLLLVSYVSSYVCSICACTCVFMYLLSFAVCPSLKAYLLHCLHEVCQVKGIKNQAAALCITCQSGSCASCVRFAFDAKLLQCNWCSNICFVQPLANRAHVPAYCSFTVETLAMPCREWSPYAAQLRHTVCPT